MLEALRPLVGCLLDAVSKSDGKLPTLSRAGGKKAEGGRAVWPPSLQMWIYILRRNDCGGDCGTCWRVSGLAGSGRQSAFWLEGVRFVAQSGVGWKSQKTVKEWARGSKRTVGLEKCV